MTLLGPHGVLFALVAALLFGASTPLAKVLLGTVDPVLLAGLLYLGSGSGLVLWRWLRCWRSEYASREAGLKRSDLPWLTGAIVTGGVIAPVLLMIGLATTPASSASLLLNLESVFTTILAWCVFKEHYNRRLVWGMAGHRGWRPCAVVGRKTGTPFLCGRHRHRWRVSRVGD